MKMLTAISRFSGSVIKTGLLLLLKVYKFAVSPVLHMIAPGGGCRFYPTCSDYAMEAVKCHGPLRGGWLALRRVAKCHPLGSHGFDPVPHSCSCTSKRDHQHPTPFTPSQPEQHKPHGG